MAEDGGKRWMIAREVVEKGEELGSCSHHALGLRGRWKRT